jgi:hypothetical protein
MYAVKPFRYGLPAISESTQTPRKVERRPLPSLDDGQLKLLRIDQLREALRLNAISFPSQVPVFNRHDRPDLQWKFAQLYYVLGWSSADIAARYGIVTQRAGQILNAWTRRAVALGYIQVIPPVEAGVAPSLVSQTSVPQASVSQTNVPPASVREPIVRPAVFPVTAVNQVAPEPITTP